MGKKYIIEIEDEPIVVNRVEYWQVKKFPTIFFSAEELNELEEYKEPAGHKFEVGDVCKFADSDSNVIITRITSDDIFYLWDDGINGTRPRSMFEHKVSFVRHSNEFYSFFKGGLNELD